MEENILWVPVAGYIDYYEISIKGVKSLVRPYRRKERMLKLSISSHGYVCVGLCKNGKLKTKTLHRLLMTAFVPNPLKLKYINHKDGNKANFDLDNLEWSTKRDDSLHAYRTGLNTPKKGSLNGMCKIPESKIIEISKSTQSDDALAMTYGVTARTVQYIKSGRTWSHITGIIYEKTEKLPDNTVIEISNSTLSTKALMTKYNLKKEVILNIKKGAAYGSITKIKYHRKKIIKFSNEEIIYIMASTESNTKLGTKYGVNKETIRRIKNKTL